METNGNTEFSPEIEIAFYEIAEAMNAEDSDDALFDACLILRESIKDEEIGTITRKLIETAENEAFDTNTIQMIFMHAQQTHLNELKPLESSDLKVPNTVMLERIYEDMNAHSGDNDKQASVIFKLVEILKEPTKIDMQKLMAHLILASENTDFEDLLNFCVLRAQDIAIKEFTAKPEAPLELGRAPFIFTTLIGEA